MSATLHDAAFVGDVHLCASLLSQGASLHHQTLDGTPLHCAARAGHLDVCSLLIDEGAEVDVFDKGESTPLLVAASYGRTDVCLFLIDRGASLQAKSKLGRSALHEATFFNQLPSILALIGRGADLTAKNIAGEVPFDCAHRDLMLDLIANGVIDPKGRLDTVGVTARQAAAERGHSHLLHGLLGKEASSERGDDLASLMRLAKRFNRHEVVAVIRSFEAQLAVDRVLSAPASDFVSPSR